VSVVFDPAKGKDVRLGKVRLTTTSTDGVQKGSISYRPRTKGKLIVSYAGTTVGDTLADTRAADTARVLIRR
jgi:hypothetical protein